MAYTVCCHYGLDTSDYSFGYIAGWSSDKELDELKKSMDIIRSTASEIIKGIDEKLIRAEQEEKVETLAAEINQFAKDYDHYGYMDAVDDPEKQIEDIKTDIKSGNVEYLQEWFRPILEEKEPADMYEQAKDITERLSEYSRVKPAEHIAEKPASLSEAVEMKDVVKHHHRSH